MAAERLSMRRTREVLRHRWELRCSYRQIKRALGVALATVSDTIARATAAHLDWAAVTALSDDELESRLYPKAPDGIERPLPGPATLDIELRKAGVTRSTRHEDEHEHEHVATLASSSTRASRAGSSRRLCLRRRVLVCKDLATPARAPAVIRQTPRGPRLAQQSVRAFSRA